jgi:hypothetical protein
VFWKTTLKKRKKRRRMKGLLMDLKMRWISAVRVLKEKEKETETGDATVIDTGIVIMTETMIWIEIMTETMKENVGMVETGIGRETGITIESEIGTGKEAEIENETEETGQGAEVEAGVGIVRDMKLMMCGIGKNLRKRKKRRRR